MIELLKEVGRGKKGARDLPYELALKGAQAIVSGSATPAQTGAFLLAERIKTESPEEIRAFVDALRPHCARHPLAGSIDCAGPGDGRRRSFLATLPVAFVLSACGLPTVLHGGPPLPPKWGVTASDALHALGIPADEASRAALIAAAETAGVLYAPIERWCPPLGALRSMRRELGVRTVLNTAEKLLRPADSPCLAVGVFHAALFEKLAELLVALGVRRALIVQGVEGSEDVSAAQRAKALLIRASGREALTIDPENYGLRSELPEREWTAAEQAETVRAVLDGTAAAPYRNMVLLNGAVRLWAAGMADSVGAGLEMADRALREGRARQRFEHWARILRR